MCKILLQQKLNIICAVASTDINLRTPHQRVVMLEAFLIVTGKVGEFLNEKKKKL